jgi:hypothetical protein
MFVIAMHGLLINGWVEGIYGIHGWEMPIESFSRYVLLSNYVQAIVFVFPALFSKLALLVFYIKLQNREPWFKWSVWFTMFVVVGSNIGILFSVAFACQPIAMAYDVQVTEGTCIDRPAVFKATAAFGVITDVMIFLIPVPMVLKLHISTRKKIGVLAIFFVGSATVVTSIVRLYLLIISLPKMDFSWIGGPIFIWVSIEANLLVMCACLPTLKHFVQAIAPSILGSRSGGNSGYKANGYNSAGLRSGPRTNAISGTFTTSRSRPRRENYTGFDGDEEWRMQTLVESNNLSTANTATKSRDDSVGDKDDDSAKGIMQTRTVQIQYEDRDGPL